MKNAINVIVTILLIVIAFILVLMWLIFGSIYLVTMIIRLMSLYTISLIQSFIGGTQPNEDYNTGIQTVFENYFAVFFKILSLPQLPWLPKGITEDKSLKKLLESERADIKKNWFITTSVFLTYIISFAWSSAYLFHRTYNTFIIDINQTEELIKEINEERVSFEKDLSNLDTLIATKNKELKNLDNSFTLKKERNDMLEKLLYEHAAEVDRLVKNGELKGGLEDSDYDDDDESDVNTYYGDERDNNY